MTGSAVPPGGDGADLVAGYIAAWQPSSVPPPAAAFARAVAARAGPGTRARANALLWAAARLAAFGDPARAGAGAGGAAAPVGDRAVRRVRARAVRPGAPDAAHEPAVPGPAGGPGAGTRRTRACRGSGPRRPTARREIAGYLALADAQPTVARRMRAAGLVCLGAGAGLTGADLRGVRGADVACRSGGVLVEVRGARPRAVPVLARYHQRLLACAAFAGSGLVTGGTSAVRKNITTPLTRSLAGGTGLPRLEASRLRATWLAECAQLLGLATFMHAAGITCSQRLGDLLAALDPADEADAVALLGGTR